jgi:hypothetical protein
MADDQKDTIYIDIDDEITSVIDKMQSSPKKIVALVLPKRATVFQSIVNMKLLKRTADDAKKHVVLITSESALMPLAGAVGIHVAKTPQTKPEIPPAPMAASAAANAPAEDVDLDKSATVGALSGVPDEDESLEVDNGEPEATSAAAKGDKKGKKEKKPKGAGGKKLKIPNFEKFRTKLFLGAAALILLIVGFVLAFMVLPKATVTLATNTDNIDVNETFTTDPNAQEFDQQNKVLPSVSKEFRKTDTEKVAATGEKNLGKKASGEVTLKLTNCDADQVTIPAGTTVSTSNMAYVTQSRVTLQSVEIGGECRNDDFSNISSKSTGITASEAGEKYNIGSDKSFSVAGYSAVSGSNDSSISGGTDKIVKVITDEDINKAKDTIAKRAGNEAPDELTEDIKSEGYRPLDATLTSSQPTVTSSPNVGAEASEVTVTSTTVFTMTGVKEDDLKKLIEETAKSKIDPETQGIRDNGLDDATISVENKGAGGQFELSLQATVVAGPDLDEEKLKKDIAGKKRGEIQDMLKKLPGVNDVEVAYSPFWVQATPKSANKIDIVIKGNDDSQP